MALWGGRGLNEVWCGGAVHKINDVMLFWTILNPPPLSPLSCFVMQPLNPPVKMISCVRTGAGRTSIRYDFGDSPAVRFYYSFFMSCVGTSRSILC